MGKFIDIFIDRPIFASMLILALVVVGAAAFTGLGVDRLPSVDLPTINVRTTLPGASPEEVETSVSEIVEEAVNTVDGVDELRSISGPGSSNVIVTFRLDRDIDTAAQDVRDKVAAVVRRLPREVDPPIVSKFDNDSTPVMTFALSGPVSLRELSEIADKTVKPVLERSKGVGEVALVGQAERTINIFMDADKLAAQGLPVSDVSDAIARDNTEIPGGNLTERTSEQNLRTMGKLTSADQFAEVIVRRSSNGSVVRLKDIARVEDGRAELRSVARLNGQPSVSLDIRRQSGANSVAVIEAVKENAKRAQALLPPGVKLEVIRDQSNYIYAALHEIDTHLILGSILACLVVLLFTRSWRSVIIAGVAIPASVVSTFAMMYLLGFTLNSVTMLALVLMVGIVIDDAIVVLENIFRFVEDKKMSPMQAARAGTQEIALAVLATTLSLAVIFVPGQLHEQRDRPLPVPVRHHGGGGGAGQPGGELRAHAHAQCADARQGGPRSHAGARATATPAARGGFYRLYRRHLHLAAALDDEAALVRGGVRAGGHRVAACHCTWSRPRASCPPAPMMPNSKSAVGSTTGHELRRPSTSVDAQRSKPTCAAFPEIRTVLATRRWRLHRRREPGATSTSASRRTRNATLTFTRLLERQRSEGRTGTRRFRAGTTRRTT